MKGPVPYPPTSKRTAGELEVLSVQSTHSFNLGLLAITNRKKSLYPFTDVETWAKREANGLAMFINHVSGQGGT